MKKLMFIFAVALLCACNNTTETTNDSVVDTTVVDTVVIDTTIVDTAVQIKKTFSQVLK